MLKGLRAVACDFLTRENSLSSDVKPLGEARAGTGQGNKKGEEEITTVHNMGVLPKKYVPKYVT